MSCFENHEREAKTGGRSRHYKDELRTRKIKLWCWKMALILSVFGTRPTSDQLTGNVLSPVDAHRCRPRTLCGMSLSLVSTRAARSDPPGVESSCDIGWSSVLLQLPGFYFLGCQQAGTKKASAESSLIGPPPSCLRVPYASEARSLGPSLSRDLPPR